MFIPNMQNTLFSTNNKDPWGVEALLNKQVIVDRNGVKFFVEETGQYEGEITVVKKPYSEALTDSVEDSGIKKVLGNLKQLLTGIGDGSRIPRLDYLQNYRKKLAYYEKLQEHLYKVVFPKIRKIYCEKKLEGSYPTRLEDVKKIFSYFKEEEKAKTFISHAFAKYQMCFSKIEVHLKGLGKTAKKIDVLVKQLQISVTELEELSSKHVNLSQRPTSPTLFTNEEKEEEIDVTKTLNITFKEDPFEINEAYEAFQQPPDLIKLEKDVDEFYNSQQWEEGGVEKEYIVKKIKEFDLRLNQIKKAIPKARVLETRISDYLAEKKLILHGPTQALLKVFSVSQDINLQQKIKLVVCQFFDHRKAVKGQMKQMSAFLVKFEQPKVFTKIETHLNWLYLLATLGRKLTRFEILSYSARGVPTRPNEL